MKYYAHSVTKHIIDKIEHSAVMKGHRMIITIPSLPEQLLINICNQLTNEILKKPEFSLILKIAHNITTNWTVDGRKMITTYGWVTKNQDLTFFRNADVPEDKISLIILMGTDRAIDSAGLEDFYNCDFDTVWQHSMNRSFNTWFIEKINPTGINIRDSHLSDFERICLPLRENGRADLVQISTWLEKLDFSSLDDPSSISATMLSNLSYFGLPNMIGFPLSRKSSKLKKYIQKAGDFFSYSLFMDSKEREKAISNIDDLKSNFKEGNDIKIDLENEHIRGWYDNGLRFLEGLEKYILNDDKLERTKLLTCDFITLHDKILKYKLPANKEKKESITKITGGPVEMVLSAIWTTLGEFAFNLPSKDESSISSIRITGEQFRHDIEGIEEDSQCTLDNIELAREYLNRLIGGVDNLISERLNIELGKQISVECNLSKPDLSCRHSRTAEPQLVFCISIITPMSEPVQKRFAWRLPENHSYRLAEGLILRTYKSYSNNNMWYLPVFHVPYYDELLLSNSDEEIRRVLLHCIRDSSKEEGFFTNLLSPDWIATKEPLIESLKAVAITYRKFIGYSTEKGLFSALFQESLWFDLRKSINDAFKLISNEMDITQISSAGMLLRAFLVVQRRSSSKETAWHSDPYESSGIVTILHPVLLEMLEAQVSYFFSCFNYAVRQELGKKQDRNSFADSTWQSYIDLAEIKNPLAGLLVNEQLNIGAGFTGSGLIHCLGESDNYESTLSTRLLVNYGEGSDDEDKFSDVEIFRITSESRLLIRIFKYYLDTHPHARDGMTIGIFRNDDIQPVIAAIHEFLRMIHDPKNPDENLLREKRRHPYALNISFFSTSGDDIDIASLIEQWQDRWKAAESDEKYVAYRNCRLTVAHRLIESSDISIDSPLMKMINRNFNVDIAVMYNFIGTKECGVNIFKSVNSFDTTSRTLKFPILDKIFCSIKNPSDLFKRSRIVSNRQFILGSLHANLMHMLKSKQNHTSTILIGTGDFSKWRKTLDALHGKSEWVVCVDPNIDERLIKHTTNSTQRNIIGFGSGVGIHGEDNYTISTQTQSYADISLRVQSSISTLYPSAGWSAKTIEAVASLVLREAQELSGLSVVRATGMDDQYIHDFMAFSLARHLLKANGDFLCDTIVSLDAYQHWFDQQNKKRPDLLWVVARIDKGNRIHLELSLIECKLGQASNAFLSKARSQINNGFETLVPVFTPMKTENDNIEDTKPDRRYWWMQLHRLIASKSEVEKKQESSVLDALEHLSEGEFTIGWNAMVLAYWTNSNETISRIGEWVHQGACTTAASIYVIGSKAIMNQALDPENYRMELTQLRQIADIADGNVCDTIEEEAEVPGNISNESNVDEDEVEIPIFNDPKDLIDENPPYFPQPSKTPVEEIIPNIKEPAPLLGTPVKSYNRVLLGFQKTVPVYWEFDNPQLSNRHMLIFGSSGQGKTYAIQCLLAEMKKIEQNSLIIDYTNGFLPNQLEPTFSSYLNPKQHVVKQTPLPINPFKAQESDNGGIILKESSNDISKRVSGIFKSVYDIGDQQYSALYQAIKDGVDSLGHNMNLDALGELIETLLENKSYKTSAQSLKTKILPFINDHPFACGSNAMDWNDIFHGKNSICHIFQLIGLDIHSSRLVTEFILWDLYGFLQSKGNKSDPRVIVLDEVQNLDHSEGTPLSKYLREGRKFGISLICATQTISNMKKDQQDRMFNAGHKLFFKPADTEINSFAEIAASVTQQKAIDWKDKLASLQKGECYSLGQTFDESKQSLVYKGIKIRIASLEERGFTS